MNKFKRILALTIAVMMIAAMGAVAFADDPTSETKEPDYSITVNKAVAGETYTAYKMFDLSVDDPTNPTAYRYTVNEAWKAFAETEEFKAVFTVDDQGYITSTETSTTTWSATSTLSKVADAAAEYAKNNSIAEAGHVTIAEGGTSGKIELTEAGYYVVTSTLGSRAMIDTTPDSAAVEINEKNEEDTIEKEVKEDSTGEYGDSNDAQVGDIVEFKSVAKIAARSINVKIHDTMTEGLTFTEGSIKIFTGAELTEEYTDYTVQTTPDEGDTFTISIPDTFAATAIESQYLYITYTATLNEKAIVKDEDGNVAIEDQTNTTQITYGDKQSQEDETTTTTHKFEIKKHNASDDLLADAHFRLWVLTAEATDDAEAEFAEVPVVKIDDTNYRVAVSNETGEDIVTVTTGNIVVWGVDSDTYYLEETEAPEGYNLLTDKQEVTVDAENTTEADVLNQSGAELPSTGGTGTTVLYIVGSLLVLGAGVILISKRRVG